VTPLDGAMPMAMYTVRQCQFRNGADDFVQVFGDWRWMAPDFLAQGAIYQPELMVRFLG